MASGNSLKLARFRICGRNKMMGTTHTAFALLCYYTIAYLAQLPFDKPMVLILLIIGSLLPDIDHPSAFLAQQSYLFRRVSRSVDKLVTHRGMIHSFLAAIAATFIVWIIAWLYRWEMLAIAGFFTGYISHLTIDSLNPTGIKWLQPFSKAKVGDGIKTGSAVEKAFFFLVVIGVLAIFYAAYPEVFNKFLEQGLPQV